MIQSKQTTQYEVLILRFIAKPFHDMAIFQCLENANVKPYKSHEKENHINIPSHTWMVMENNVQKVLVAPSNAEFILVVSF